jgi:IS30 family transposase
MEVNFLFNVHQRVVMKLYKHLTREQRYQIYAFKKSGWTNAAIGDELGVHKSSIGRELKRNHSKRGYRPKQADKLAVERRKGKVQVKITDQTWREIEADLVEQEWSPEQISGRRELAAKQKISPEWIYQRIYKDKRKGGELYRHLRSQKKRKKRYGTNSKRGGLVNQVSIEKRPSIVDHKTRIGDWELDTIIGKGHQGAIVTIVDRKSKLLRMEKVEKKTGELTKKAICKKLKGFEVKTLTADNGKEFSDHEKIAKQLNAGFYFCHPYTSNERGLNENTNGLIRQYFPKKTEFDKITDNDIKLVEDKLNNRPRKTLGYQTPNEVYFKEQEQLRKVALTT